MRKEGGIRLEVPEVGRNFRLDQLLAREGNSGSVRMVFSESDHAEQRRFVALDGLRLAHDLLRPRPKQLYTAEHTVYFYAADARVYGHTMVQPTIGDIRNNNAPLGAVTSSQLRAIESTLPDLNMYIGNDLHSAPLVVELDPSWQCETYRSNVCLGVLDLLQALRPASYSRLVQVLDLFQPNTPDALLQ